MPNKESANELFHFTNKYDYIKSILNDKFKPFFCVEDISYMYEEGRNMTLAYPMVCFCDIPLERIAVHRENYGKYGIGLKKEWGMENELSIVNYSHNRSIKSSANRILVDYNERKCRGLMDDLSHNFRIAFSILLMVTKPYEGRVFNKVDGTWSESKVRFYNEREWRFIPLIDSLRWYLALDEFSGSYDDFYKAFKEEEPKIQEKYNLNFTVDDITHIFLKDRSEKEKLLNDIRGNYNDADLEQIEKLIYIEKDEVNRKREGGRRISM